MKSNTLFKLILLTTILLMNLQNVVAFDYPGNGPEPDPEDPGEEEENTEPNNPTVRAPVPIGAVIASIAVMLLVTYRSRLS